MVPHYLGTILTDLEAEDIFSRVPIADEISEVSQYNSIMEDLTVHPKHVTLPNNENVIKCIAGMESIENPFNVNLSLIINIREVVSVSSGQEGIK